MLTESWLAEIPVAAYAVLLLPVIGGVLGIVVASLKIRQLGMEIRKLRHQSQKPELILRPTLREILRYGGEISNLHQRIKRRAEAAAKEDDQLFEGAFFAILIAFLALITPARRLIALYVASNATVPRHELSALLRWERAANLSRVVATIGGIAASFVIAGSMKAQQMPPKELCTVAVWSGIAILVVGVAIVLLIASPDWAAPEPRKVRTSTTRSGENLVHSIVLRNRIKEPLHGRWVSVLHDRHHFIEKQIVELTLEPSSEAEVRLQYTDVPLRRGIRIIGHWEGTIPELEGIVIRESG